MPALDYSPTSTREAADAAYLSAHVHHALMPEAPRHSSPPPELPSHLAFSHDIYGSSAQVKSTEQKLLATDPSKIHFTTPAQDAKSHTQPDYYLNAQGKLVKNPHATPHKDGSISIEVEGNNSARKAEQYANQMQVKAVKDLIRMFQLAHPGEKIPEMWEAIAKGAPPDSQYKNTGDSQNNNTVTGPEEQAYDGNTSAPADTPPADNPNPVSSSDGAPSSAPSDGSGSAPASDGGSPGGYSSEPSTPSNLPSEVSGDGGASTSGLQQSSGSIANYNQSEDTNQKSIMGEANGDVGKAMWGGWSGATAVEGCAASVSQVLDNAAKSDPSIFTHGGLHNAQDDNVDGLQADLLANGWTVTSTPQPGDVWVGRGGASSGHTGIVGENDTLLNNNSSDGKFSSDPLSMTKEWTNSVFLKPPAKA